MVSTYVAAATIATRIRITPAAKDEDREPTYSAADV